MIPAVVERLVEYAAKAPSGDNAQPWRFVYRPDESTLSIELDESRVDSPKEMWRFIARLSCGAAMENLFRAAPALGLEAAAQDPRDGELGRVLLRPLGAAGERSEALESLNRRMTNRKVYSRTPVPQAIREKLERATPARGNVGTLWICDRDRIDALAEPMFQLDAAMYGIRLVWKSIERRIRFDRPWKEAVSVGLSRGALELPRLRVWAMRGLGRVPHAWLRALGIVKAFSRRTRDLIRSASGLCYVVSDDDRPETDFRGGRALQAAWLAVAREGFSAHPMNTIALMEHVINHGEPELRKCVDETPVRRWIAEFRAQLPEARGRRSVFLMRFGHAAPPTTRNGRLPVEEILR